MIRTEQVIFNIDLISDMLPTLIVAGNMLLERRMEAADRFHFTEGKGRSLLISGHLRCLSNLISFV